MQRLNFIKEVIFTPIEVDRASSAIARSIKDYYNCQEEIIVLVVLEGAKRFAKFLFSQSWLGCLNKFKVYHIKASSYIDNKKISNGGVCVDLLGIKPEEWENKNILIVDDIYDTGNTLATIVSMVRGFNPNDIKCAVLLERNIKRDDYIDEVKFVGLEVDTEDYLVGCGLDYKGSFRDLNYVASIRNIEDLDSGVDWGSRKEEIYKTCLCNQCGESCHLETNPHESKESFYGLINATARGHYSSPILADCTAYKFDLCEKCLKELFDSFKLSVDEFEYHPWTGKILD